MADSHIVPMPKAFVAVRIVQAVLALVVTALAGFLISRTTDVSFGAEGFAIACGIFTLIIVTYDIVSEHVAKAAYNKIAILALDILMVVFWLSAMSSLAHLRSIFTIPVTVNTFNKRELFLYATNTYLAVLVVAAVFSGLEFILFVGSLIMFGLSVRNHGSSGSPDNTGPSPEKIELGQGHVQSQVNPADQHGQLPVYQNEQQMAYQQHPNQYSGQQQPIYQQQPMNQPQSMSQPQPMYQQQPVYQQQPMKQQQPMNHQQPTNQQQVINQQQPVYQEQPYQPAGSPPPQLYPTPAQSPAPQQQHVQPSQYPAQPPPQGYVEAPAAGYNGKS